MVPFVKRLDKACAKYDAYATFGIVPHPFVPRQGSAFAISKRPLPHLGVHEAAIPVQPGSTTGRPIALRPFEA